MGPGSAFISNVRFREMRGKTTKGGHCGSRAGPSGQCWSGSGTCLAECLQILFAKSPTSTSSKPNWSPAVGWPHRSVSEVMQCQTKLLWSLAVSGRLENQILGHTWQVPIWSTSQFNPTCYLKYLMKAHQPNKPDQVRQFVLPAIYCKRIWARKFLGCMNERMKQAAVFASDF